MIIKVSKIRLTRVILCLMIALMLTAQGCKKSENTGTQNVNVSTAADETATVRYIFFGKGLEMREKPDEKSKKIVLIGSGEKVKLISEEKDTIFLMGEYGRWTQVSWKDKTGWVFGGYLRNYDPLLLKKAAAEYYNAIWKKYVEEWYAKVKKGEAIPKETKIFYNQTEKDIKIEDVAGDFAVVSHWTSDQQGAVDGFESDEGRSDLWQYENGTWKECKTVSPKSSAPIDAKNAKVKLFYLNNDVYPDIIIYGGCCDWLDVYVLLGKENKTFEQISQYGEVDTDYDIIAGRCEKAILRFPDLNESGTSKGVKSYKFDCKTNKFIREQ